MTSSANVADAMHDQAAMARAALRIKDLLFMRISCWLLVIGYRLRKPRDDIITYDVDCGKDVKRAARA